ncbi:MAG TPA: phosphate ABC transporter permease PstA [bacterium]|nr:phosphate ABC transporter permease PstA [bacterium]
MHKPMTPTGSSGHRLALVSQNMAFGAIRVMSVLTIIILGTILGFILYKGLRYSNIYRSTFLSYAEASPDGLAVVVNGKQDITEADWEQLYGMFTDEYINWAKLDESDFDLVPIAIDPATPDGALVQSFLFGAEAQGGVPQWGGLVEYAASANAAVQAIADRQGAITIVPASAIQSVTGVKTIPLRRLSLILNPDVTAFVGESYIEDLTTNNVRDILMGQIHNWKELGGPDLPVLPVSPPADAAVVSAIKKAGLAYQSATGISQPTDTASYLTVLQDTSGAVGLAFAGDATNAGLPLASLTSVRTGWNLTFKYLVEAPRLSGKTGGISSIIANTVFMLLLTIAFAAPLGVAAAIYLVEYARQGRLLRLLRLGTETLAGIPSIIFGLFGFLFFVGIMGFGFGLLSGSLTVTLMILPTIIRTAEEALKSVPRSLREGSLALGATKLQTILRVVVPAASPGILTGLILAVGRAVGETAALLFTMGSDYKLAKGLFSSARGLSAHVYLLFAEGISFDKAFSTATVLVVVVLLFNFIAKRVIGRMNRSATA